MKALVTGGAGYIGSFMVEGLLQDNTEVVVVDKVSPNNNTEKIQFIKGDLTNRDFVQSVFKKHKFDIVFHFAGVIAAGESMKDPGKYFDNNTFATLNILEQLKDQPKKKIIFSSTAAVYGNPITVPIPEDHPKNPTSVYGESKLMIEDILAWYEEIFDISFVALRYFNASGASLDGNMGESHIPETHIIPCAIDAILKNKPFLLFGSDYDTPDGSCVRDYIHVLDLIEAHILAAKKIANEKGTGYRFNVGTGVGYSNKEVLQMIEKVSGKKMEIKIEPRREGDSSELTADASKIKEELGFEPKHSDLETIVSSAWKYHNS